jgi:DNA-binding MarR family transcriptional regulator
MSRQASSQLKDGFSLWRKAMRWQRAVDAALADLELTHTQFLALLSTAEAERENKDAVTQRQIAAHAGLDESTTSRLVKTLVKRGLLDRGDTAGDQRAWRVIVTRSGSRLLDRAKPVVEGAAKRFAAAAD